MRRDDGGFGGEPQLPCGFALDEATPDETTICRFRQQASEQGVLQACFDEITRQLEARGLVTRKGTLMDATIVKARHAPPPIEAGRGARDPREPEAGWTNKGGKAHFGYKLHVGMDTGGLVRRAAFTPAGVYESEAADGLISGDAPAASAAMRAHVDSVMAELIEFAAAHPELFADGAQLRDDPAYTAFPFG